MLSEDVKERLAEALVDRIEELNETILTEIGESIKKIGKLTPSKAYQLVQQLQYGGSYNNIVNKIIQITGLNEKQIYKIFEAIAKDNQLFAKQFYDYRGVDFIPYEQNIALQNQARALAKITADTYTNFMNTSAFMMFENGKKVYTPLSQIYNKVLDKAILSISQGQEAYQTAMRNTMRELSRNGIRTVDYASGYSRRLDSAVRMNMLDGIRNLSNEMQRQFGEEFDADGVEITVHMQPAPDHAEVQGKQFSNEEFDKFQNNLPAKDYQGKLYTHEHRAISELNCYHNVFSIVLGVSKPIYSDEQLKKINEDNNKGFEFEGKKYTLYEGTQLQRQIETKIRQLKDRHIGAVAMEDLEEAGLLQNKIRILTNKYNYLCNKSGLQPKRTRMTVSGYKRIKRR